MQKAVFFFTLPVKLTVNSYTRPGTRPVMIVEGSGVARTFTVAGPSTKRCIVNTVFTYHNEVTSTVEPLLKDTSEVRRSG